MQFMNEITSEFIRESEANDTSETVEAEQQVEAAPAPEIVTLSITDALTRARKAAKMTQTDVAKAMSVPKSRITSIESERGASARFDDTLSHLRSVGATVTITVTYTDSKGETVTLNVDTSGE